MKLAIRYLAVCVLVLLVIMVTTRPTQLPAVFLVIPFILVFSILGLCASLLIGWSQGSLTIKTVRRGFLLALLPCLLIVLHAIGQLTVRDTVTLGLLSVIAYFYVVKSRVVKQA